MRRRPQLLLVGDLRDHALVGGIEELGHRRVEDHGRVGRRPERDPQRDPREERGPQQVGGDEDPLAIEAVDEDPRQQAEGQAGNRRRHEDQPNARAESVSRKMTDGRGEVGQRGADRRDQLREPELREVALPEDGEHRPGPRWQRSSAPRAGDGHVGECRGRARRGFDRRAARVSLPAASPGSGSPPAQAARA